MESEEGNVETVIEEEVEEKRNFGNERKICVKGLSLIYPES